MDLDGFYPEGLIYAWDTTSRKDDDIGRGRRCSIMNEIGQSKGLQAQERTSATRAPLGTLGMLLETSGKGALVDLRQDPRPKGVDFSQWVKSYQGCGFVVTVNPKYSDKVIDQFRTVGVTGAVVGEVDGSNESRPDQWG